MESLLLRRSKRIASKSTSDTSSPMENRLYCRANPKKYNGKESRVENSILAQAKSETPARLVKPGYKPRNEKKSEITSSIISNNSHFGTKNHKSNLETPNNGTVPTSCEYFAPMTRSRKRILESATADNIEVILIDPTSKSSILINANVGEISEMQGLKTVSPKNYTVSSEPKTPLRRSGRVALKNETTVSSSHAKKQKKTNFNNGTCGEKYTLEQQITYKKNEIVMAKMTGHMIWPAKVHIFSSFSAFFPIQFCQTILAKFLKSFFLIFSLDSGRW